MGTHDPYLYEIQDSHTMVIFIHGFMGSPNQFKQIISTAKNQGYSVSAILLPGHGGTTVDFNKSNRMAWEETVREHIGQMSKKYSNIILAGHSMGALLAFVSYGSFSEHVKGMVVIATPLRIFIKPRNVKISCAVAFGKVREDNPWEKAAYDFCSVTRASFLEYIKSLPRVFDLFHLICDTRKKLEQVEAPTLIIHSIDDEVANIKGIKVLEEKLKRTETLKLYHSGHFYYSDQDTEIIREKFIQFMNKLKMSNE